LGGKMEFLKLTQSLKLLKEENIKRGLLCKKTLKPIAFASLCLGPSKCI
jgi:hypothetical protein